jgi:hypothetical protein
MMRIKLLGHAPVDDESLAFTVLSLDIAALMRQGSKARNVARSNSGVAR